ncbi:MAG TPA: peptide-methionine (S)-S-oxide reductase MsrA [Chiayiivirga sp.]|nr:peptide-methionine (S)-S-oxide reductase MsrA [Chiayiivirga sp.]
MSLVCTLPGPAPASFPDPAFDPPPAVDATRAEVVLAGGCFWCTEAVYRQLDGVLEVVSGYSGGAAETANYKAVCTDTTGHAEVIRIAYDPRRISLGQLLKVFFSVAHDPTQFNRQGEDVGTQYRSAVFFSDELQREVAARYIARLDAAGVFPAPIVTTLEPLEAFHPAEDYHQDYAALHPDQPFIRAAALPKVEKLRKVWPDKVRPK